MRALSGDCGAADAIFLGRGAWRVCRVLSNALFERSLSRVVDRRPLSVVALLDVRPESVGAAPAPAFAVAEHAESSFAFLHTTVVPIYAGDHVGRVVAALTRREGKADEQTHIRASRRRCRAHLLTTTNDGDGLQGCYCWAAIA